MEEIRPSVPRCPLSYYRIFKSVLICLTYVICLTWFAISFIMYLSIKEKDTYLKTSCSNCSELYIEQHALYKVGYADCIYKIEIDTIYEIKYGNATMKYPYIYPALEFITKEETFIDWYSSLTEKNSFTCYVKNLDAHTTGFHQQNEDKEFCWIVSWHFTFVIVCGLGAYALYIFKNYKRQ